MSTCLTKRNYLQLLAGQSERGSKHVVEGLNDYGEEAGTLRDCQVELCPPHFVQR